MLTVLTPYFETYAGQVEEQAILATPLQNQGIILKPWWVLKEPLPAENADAVLWQTVSSYHQHISVFRGLLQQVEDARLPSFNPAALIRWNSHKTYLRALEQQAGIPLIPTLWQEELNIPAIQSAAQAKGWDELVVKPVISAGAFRTFRLKVDDEATWQEVAQAYAGAENPAVMVQPFMREIVEEGEWSFLFFGGQFSHAVLKTAKAGDYRIQHVHGGRYEAVQPPAALLQQAQRVMAELPESPFYARVDGIRRGEQFLLMEVELIEPYFYLSAAPKQAEIFAAALRTALIQQQEQQKQNEKGAA